MPVRLTAVGMNDIRANQGEMLSSEPICRLCPGRRCVPLQPEKIDWTSARDEQRRKP